MNFIKDSTECCLVPQKQKTFKTYTRNAAIFVIEK